MHIVIVGPGALGCLFASSLTRGLRASTDTVSLLDYNAGRAAIINRLGIVYEKDDHTSRFNVPTGSEPAAMAPTDVLLVCVKSYDVDDTLAFCAPLIGERTLLVFLQNGISHLKHSRYGADSAAVFATTTVGATALGAGHVRHAGQGFTTLGFLEAPQPYHAGLLPQFVALLRNGGIVAEISSDIRSAIWTKLFINVGINALTVIHDCPNGRLLEGDEARQQMRQAIAEAELVADRENIHIDAPLDRTEQVCRATADNISSMLQDVRRKRRTEIEAINGMIAALAERHGLATPMNDYLIEKVKEIEAGY